MSCPPDEERNAHTTSTFVAWLPTHVRPITSATFAAVGTSPNPANAWQFVTLRVSLSHGHHGVMLLWHELERRPADQSHQQSVWLGAGLYTL